MNKRISFGTIDKKLKQELYFLTINNYKLEFKQNISLSKIKFQID